MSWTRLRHVYNQVLEQEPSDRIAFVQAQSESDPELANEILRLLEIEDCSSSFLSKPLFAPQDRLYDSLLKAGEILDSRYRVIREIGRGGMGEVYEAEPLNGHEDGRVGNIALKVVRSALADNGVYVRRMWREARLLHRIESNPNICQVLDSFIYRARDRDLPVLVMELLEGETLSERLAKSGPMGWREAAHIAEQMAFALAAMHRAGIVHRDIKPSNVMLVDGRAVVMDFGLASMHPHPESPRPEESSVSGLTGAGQLLGTVEYMSPEQYFGRSIGPPSDIYSFGTLLYQMLTGKRPQQSLVLVEEILSRLVEPPPKPSASIAEIPSFLDLIVVRCLETDPRDRWKSAEEIAQALRRGSVQILERWSRRQIGQFARRSLIAAGATGSVAAVAWHFGAARGARENRNTPSPLVVVQTATGDENAQPVRTLIQRQLEQSTHLRIWNQNWKQALAAAGLPGGLAPSHLSGQQWLLVSAAVKATWLVRLTANQLVVRAELVPVDRPLLERVRAKDFHFSNVNRIADAAGAAASWIRAELGESNDSIAANERPPYLVTSGSVEAVALFDRAEAVREDRPKESVSLLMDSVRKDPDFALAYMRLGDMQVATSDFPNGFANWRKAIALAKSGHLTEREALRIETMYRVEIEDWQAAEAAALAWAQAFPSELRPLWEVFHSRQAMGRIPEAEKMIEPMSGKPESQRYFCLADALVAMWNNEYDRMAASAVRLRDAGSWFQGQRFLACSFAMRGDLVRAVQSAMDLVDRSKKPEEVSRAYVLVAALHAAGGKLDEARKMLLTGLDFDQRKGFESLSAMKNLGLAYLAWLTRDWQEAKVRAGLALLHGDAWTMVPRCVSVLFRTGHLSEALEARVGWERRAPKDVPRFEVSRLWMQGEALLASGDPHGIDPLKKMAAVINRTQPPEALLYGFAKSGQPALAKEMARALMERPGSLWYSPETTAVGLIHYCRQRAEK